MSIDDWFYGVLWCTVFLLIVLICAGAWILGEETFLRLMHG